MVRRFAKTAMLFCCATVVAQAAAGAVLWSRGWIDRDKLVLIAGIFQDADLIEIYQAGQAENPPKSQETLARETLEQRAQSSGVGSQRRKALRRGLARLRSAESNLKEDQRRFQEMQRSFETALAQLEQQQVENALQEVRLTLEALPAKQAKDQLIRMYNEGAEEDLIAIFRSMTLKGRRKIVEQFKTPEESQKLHRILEIVRLSEDGS